MITLIPSREPNAAQKAQIARKYGMFIQAIVNFLLIALVIFSIIKSINQFKKKKEEKPEEPAAPSEDIVLLTEIRDLLRK